MTGELRGAVARDRWQFGGLVLCWLALAGGQPVLAVSLRGLTQAALAGERRLAVEHAAGAAAAVAVLAQALFQSYLLWIELHERVGLGLTTRLMRAVAERVGIDHLEDPATLDRITLGLDGWAVVSALTNGAQLVAVTVGLALTLPVLGSATGWSLLVLPLCLPLVYASTRAFGHAVRAVEAASRWERTADSLLRTVFDPVAAGELRVTGAVSAILEEYRHSADRAAAIRVQAQIAAGRVLAVAWLVFLLGLTAILYLALDDPATRPADAVPLIAIALQLQGITVVMVNGTGEMVRGRQVARAHRAVVAEVGAVREAPSGVAPARLRHGIALRAVSFRYPRSRRDALHRLDLQLPAGAFVAVVGAHGSGKSTLVKLLTRMYEPTAGQITVDGEPLAELDARAWRARTTACFQDFVRLPTTVREAVGVGDLAALHDDDRVRRAIGLGGATSMVAALPDGLDTRLGGADEGTELSTGQWQRLALARACMREDPLLVVLDEPTASLDPLAEREIFDRDAELARAAGARSGAVTLAITHRFSTVQSADLIVVLRDGRLQECGTHDELMRRGGQYATMYAQQRDAYLG